MILHLKLRYDIHINLKCIRDSKIDSATFFTSHISKTITILSFNFDNQESKFLTKIQEVYEATKEHQSSKKKRREKKRKIMKLNKSTTKKLMTNYNQESQRNQARDEFHD